MQSSLPIKPRVLGVFFLGIFTGYAMLQSMPLADKNFIFLLAAPLFLCGIFMMIVNAEFILAGILMSRALLDPVLETTRFLGGFGLGAAINLAVIVFTAFLAFRHFKPAAMKRIYFSWILYLGIAMLGIANSVDRVGGVKLLFALVTYFCMTLIPIILVRSEQSKNFWIKLLLLSGILPTMMANIDFIKGGKYFADAGMRISGTFTHPNILAFYLLFLLVLVFIVFKTWELKRWHKNLLYVYTANLLFLFVITKTRNAWIAMWLIMVIYGILKDRKFLIISLVLPFVLLPLPPVWERVQDLFRGTGASGDVEHKLNSFAWRMELWKGSFAAIRDRLFLVGFGLASFEPLSVNFFPGEKGHPSHNTILEILFELGIFGLLAFLNIFYQAIKKFFQTMKKAAGALSAECAIMIAYMISYLFSCSGDNMLYYLTFNWYFFFLMGLLLKSTILSYEPGIRNNPVV